MDIFVQAWDHEKPRELAPYTLNYRRKQRKSQTIEQCLEMFRISRRLVIRLENDNECQSLSGGEQKALFVLNRPVIQK